MSATQARKLRRRSTDAENRLWYRLRNRQIDGVKFRRQMPIGSDILDFAAPEKRLVIELDGGQHASAMDSDASRSQGLAAKGYRVIRFWNHEVLKNIEGVLEIIHMALSTSSAESR
jgi:very-short-patch-repair endonuclease